MSKAQIMIVEDESIVALDIRKRLLSMGYAVPAIASSGEEAVYKAGEIRPDLVLMDIKLSGHMDGLETAEQIGARYEIPVVYLTAYADEATLQRAKITKPIGYLLKPLEERELQITIEMALYKHRAERKLRESERWLATTLKSIGDAVIATDAQGRIKFMNPVAEALTAWKQDEAFDKDCSRVFKVVEKESRSPIEDPIAKVLLDGSMVHLEDHSILVAKDGTETPIDDSAAPIRDDKGGIEGVVLVFRDVTERMRVEQALRERNQELDMLSRVSQTLNATLDLDQVLSNVLEEVRRLMKVVACSVWLIDPETDEVVCRQATGLQSEVVRGWRLAPGEGIAGWVARHGESQIVSDTRADERHYTGVDRQTGLTTRATLSVPLRVKEEVIGTLQMMDTEVGRFKLKDLRLVEPLAATAAIAIENARLFEQARRDAETKAVLLHEVNHRVKNNLSTIIGLLYAERRHARVEDEGNHQSIMTDLINQVHGLVATQAIRSALQALPRDKQVTVEVTPSPVRVSPDQANNLALVINELATNTVKHALQERHTARISVLISLADDKVFFEFRDNGPGFPRAVLQLEQHNVGFDLIQTIVRDGLRGDLALRNDGGAVVLIQFFAQVAAD
jgi:PAS domain S-box-containing protein